MYGFFANVEHRRDYTAQGVLDKGVRAKSRSCRFRFGRGAWVQVGLEKRQPSQRRNGSRPARGAASLAKGKSEKEPWLLEEL